MGLVRFTLSVITFSIFVTGCEIPQEQIELDPSFDRAITQYNEMLDETSLDPVLDRDKAFKATGVIVASTIEEAETSDDKRLLFDFRTLKDGIPIFHRFNFGIDDPFELPSSLTTVKLVFLGYQVILVDESSDFSANLYVQVDENTTNLVPELEPIQGYGIGKADIDKTIAKNFREGCRCGCVRCEPKKDCGSDECSCTSDCGGSCSQKCRSLYNASCWDNCPIE